MGVLTVCEYRSDSNPDGNDNVRSWARFNLRHSLEPCEALKVVLLNVFHGATKDLETGWSRDKKELEDMAWYNILTKGDEVVVGSEWRELLSKKSFRTAAEILDVLRMDHDEGRRVFVDHSRALVRRDDEENWFRSWLSGPNLSKDLTESIGDCTSLDLKFPSVQVVSDTNVQYRAVAFGEKRNWCGLLL